MVKTQREIYVITDIDGTVVPHPYHSGLTQEQRNPYVARLQSLMRNHHVACVTGRTMAGWRRLWTEAQMEPHLPRLMGLAFGSEVYFHGKQVNERIQSAELAAVVAELKESLAKDPAFRSQTDPEETMAKGTLQGYSLEEKTHILQLDWSFATEAQNLRFAENVFRVLNPHLAKKASLRCQVFHRRIDILANGFVPKAELAHHIEQWVQQTRLAHTEDGRNNGSGGEGRRGGGPHVVTEIECLVLGDELYDDYLFESTKSLAPKVFKKVTCIGIDNNVGTQFRHADRIEKDGPDGAWRAIEDALRSS